MANAILKITTFRRNIRMGKINRQDPILLKCDYSYLIQKNLRIFNLMSQIFPDKDFSNYTIPNVISNEKFGFLDNDKEKYLSNNNEGLNIISKISDEDKNDNEIEINNNDDSENEDTENIISTLLDDITILNNQSESINSNTKLEISNSTYQTSSNFLLLRTNTYPTTKVFNKIEHNTLKQLYKQQFLGRTTDFNIINWQAVDNYWNNIAGKNANPNSDDKVRPKLLEDIKSHFLIIHNYYLRNQIEGNLTG